MPNLQHAALVIDSNPADTRRACDMLIAMGFSPVCGLARWQDITPWLTPSLGLVVQRVDSGRDANPLALHDLLLQHGYRGGLVLTGNADCRLMGSLVSHARSRSLLVPGYLSYPLCADKLKRLWAGRLAVAHLTACTDQPQPITRSALAEAIDTGAIQPWYQPIIDARTHQVARIEVLARWQTQSGEWIPPDSFIPIAEYGGLIQPLFHALLGQAVEDIKRLKADGLNAPLALNLSLSNLTQKDLVETIAITLASHDIDSTCLGLEITETAITSLTQDILSCISRLRLAGYGVAIDDFGTGQSGLSHLKVAPFTELKIDRTFIQDIHLNPVSQAITKAAVVMAHDLGMYVVAEGVEQAAEAQYLREIEVDELQGFLFARPMPGDAVLDWHAAWKTQGIKALLACAPDTQLSASAS
ncbi:EAL domain-containing protein [Vreelandella rituensis]|uniref:EAL domain-containing protein n=1 Tax=Vreelandella rituensis TaxID=2282306 RepID=A0A368U9I8_9GAMM|nr:EAL domain-containing protein [Halomonas rituensis]RCV93770.1 EAL domain-containing protein [Halomonas rituensis]